MNLPVSFLEKMSDYFHTHKELNEQDFFNSFNESSMRGIRLNSRKVSGEIREKLIETFQLDRNIDWCENGYYLDTDGLGRNPYYHTGAFYIQEPSAMLPAEVLAPRQGDTVLDLCAAPGGKATRFGEFLDGTGLLVANEISKDRSRALLRNIELFGLENVVITNENPQNLAKRFPDYFDKILVDAPCSGEGMFRNDPQAVKSWEKFGPDVCVKLQEEILNNAAQMLKTGGSMVYSTCTFNPEENENQIDRFLQAHPEYVVIPHPEIKGVSNCDGIYFKGAMRIWPQISTGDGHFCVHLQKVNHSPQKLFQEIPERRRKVRGETYSARTARESFLQFCNHMLTEQAYTEQKNKQGFLLFGDKLHLLPVPVSRFDDLKVVKMGAYPGSVKHTDKEVLFLPSHSFALSLSREKMKEDKYISLDFEDERIWRYLSGETILLSEKEQECISNKGYILLVIGNLPLGWGKRSGKMIKNEYPPAWRLR